jgi:hypothetical protein
MQRQRVTGDRRQLVRMVVPPAHPSVDLRVHAGRAKHCANRRGVTTAMTSSRSLGPPGSVATARQTPASIASWGSASTFLHRENRRATRVASRLSPTCTAIGALRTSWAFGPDRHGSVCLVSGPVDERIRRSERLSLRREMWRIPDGFCFVASATERSEASAKARSPGIVTVCRT